MSHSLRDVELSGCGTARFFCLCSGFRWVNILLPGGLGWRGGWGETGNPNLGSSSETVAICMCVSMQRCVCAWHKTHHADSFFPLPFPQPCAANEQWLDCWLWCEMSAVCLRGTCHFDRRGFPPPFHSLSICFCEGVYMFSMEQLSPAGTIKKTHRSFPFLMLCCWHSQHSAQLFLFPL